MNKNIAERIIAQVDEDRRPYFEQLHQTIVNHLPEGFEVGLSYGALGYVVPHSMYPGGYHCKPEEPLPFVSIAAQKNSINLYHMGIYADKDLLNWFTEAYPLYSRRKLDMGKSCIRFKHYKEIPYELIGLLMEKMNPTEWIALYESKFRK